MAAENAKVRLQTLLALLRAMHLMHHTAHWQVKGPTFLSDHELFGALYEDLPGEADSLAEKMVYMFGVDVVSIEDQLTRLTAICQTSLEQKDLLQRAMHMEEWLQKVIEGTRQALESEKLLSDGLDNYLQGLADTHQTACYKLKQRTS